MARDAMTGVGDRYGGGSSRRRLDVGVFHQDLWGGTGDRLGTGIGLGMRIEEAHSSWICCLISSL
jgi:hypothetical protein